MSFLSALRNGVSTAWISLVKWLNGAAITVLGGLALAYQAYPTYITGAFDAIPGPLKLVAILAFCTLVHIALTRAQKGPGT